MSSSEPGPFDPSLFAKVVALSGLSPLFGPGTVRRALNDAGADAATAVPDDYRRALPRLEARLRGFFAPHEAAVKVRAIHDYLGERETAEHGLNGRGPSR